jgi:hypothetical protein
MSNDIELIYAEVYCDDYSQKSRKTKVQKANLEGLEIQLIQHPRMTNETLQPAKPSLTTRSLTNCFQREPNTNKSLRAKLSTAFRQIKVQSSVENKQITRSLFPSSFDNTSETNTDRLNECFKSRRILFKWLLLILGIIIILIILLICILNWSESAYSNSK